MSDVFISYASADRERARLLSKELARRGWSTWWDRTIPPGKEFDQVIEEALDSARCVVVLWSHASVASSWVKTEAAEAMRRKILLPALIEEVKIPLEFRRLQAADLSTWTGEPGHPGLEEFFQSIDRMIHGSGVMEVPAIPAVPPPVQPPAPAPIRPWTRAAWPAAALIAALVVAAIFWRSPRDDSSVPAQEVSPPAQEVGRASAVPAVPDQPEPVRQSPVADAPVTNRPASASPRPPAREPGRVVDESNTPKPSKPPGGAPVDPKPLTPTAVQQPPTMPPSVAPSESSTPERATGLPVASPKEFEEIIWAVTKDGETEELEIFLLFNDNNLVLKDEDLNILRTLPYTNIQKVTYSPTRRQIMRLFNTTRHWMTLRVGREEIVLRLPDETHLAIYSQIEQRTGLKIERLGN